MTWPAGTEYEDVEDPYIPDEWPDPEPSALEALLRGVRLADNVQEPLIKSAGFLAQVRPVRNRWEIALTPSRRRTHWRAPKPAGEARGTAGLVMSSARRAALPHQGGAVFRGGGELL